MFLLYQNIFSLPLLCFFSGLIMSMINQNFSPKKALKLLGILVLFLTGLKGGYLLVNSSGLISGNLLKVFITTIFVSFLLPFIAFYFLKYFPIDLWTAAVIASCFGSVSVMTFIMGASYLDEQQVFYEKGIGAFIAIMEIPGIITGMILAKKLRPDSFRSMKKFLYEISKSFKEKTIVSLFLGLFIGCFIPSYWINLDLVQLLMRTCLFCFLFVMGYYIGLQRVKIKELKISMIVFGLIAPLLSACMGLFMGYLFVLDPGTTTLISILLASASYIAVPAIMKNVLPEAKETIYVPLSLCVTFPFNVVIGIPLYHQLAKIFVS